LEITVAGHHLTLSSGMKERLTKDLGRLERFYEPLIDAHVTLTQEGPLVRTDLVVNVHGRSLKAEGEHEKPAASFDAARERMERQLKRLHDRRRRARPLPRGVA
jgi:putative sigma-54 modulation protein